jgi:hypothetical protein
MATKRPTTESGEVGRAASAGKSPKPTADAPASRCPQCGSTNRTPYTHTTRHECNGEHEGKPFNRVTWRSTSCRDCGQHRRDKTRELV